MPEDEPPQPASASTASAAGRYLTRARSAASPSSTETASVSLHEAVAVALEQVGVREPEPDAVGDREPALPAQHVHLVHAVEQARLEHQLVVERRLERDRDAAVARDRPALAADVLDEHLLGLEHVPVDLEPAAVELLELAARELLADRAEPRAELRPEHRQVRLHAQLRRLDLSEHDLLDAKLVGDLVRVRTRQAARLR